MGQLVPRLSEGLFECPLILGEALRDSEVAGSTYAYYGYAYYGYAYYGRAYR